MGIMAMVCYTGTIVRECYTWKCLGILCDNGLLLWELLQGSATLGTMARVWLHWELW